MTNSINVILISRHHREIAFLKLWIKTDKLLAPGCDAHRSLTPRYDAHRGVWLCGGMHTAEFLENFLSLDSAMWCTPRSLTPQWDAHPGARLHGVQQTAESDYAVGCALRSFLKIRISRQNLNPMRKYFSLFIRRLDGFESWKKMEVKNLMTHSLQQK